MLMLTFKCGAYSCRLIMRFWLYFPDGRGPFRFDNRLGKHHPLNSKDSPIWSSFSSFNIHGTRKAIATSSEFEDFNVRGILITRKVHDLHDADCDISLRGKAAFEEGLFVYSTLCKAGNKNKKSWQVTDRWGLEYYFCNLYSRWIC